MLSWTWREHLKTLILNDLKGTNQNRIGRASYVMNSIYAQNRYNPTNSKRLTLPELLVERSCKTTPSPQYSGLLSNKRRIKCKNNDVVIRISGMFPPLPMKFQRVHGLAGHRVRTQCHSIEWYYAQRRYLYITYHNRTGKTWHYVPM